MVKRPGAPAPKEADRLSRPQPPRVIPPRVPTPASAPGTLAYTLLGAQVVK